ncbi:endonuclease/exonuclease/phosphatase family protein [Vibrio parahaemolyticus]|nr:endonuclease/exonuclease/phosphatase family protein [Vibrio parahaemolyticus]MDG2604265.1 endonuclease/exonuclease/phosphatase family protein [Vibrio parahaemolyticus]
MKTLAGLLCLVCLQVQAITISTINTEWLWDYKEPHEGQVVGYEYDDIYPPTRKEYEMEVFALAQVIKAIDADVVGLIEVEGRHVVEDIAAYLPEWNVVFVEGRDTFTKQDVAILTRFSVIEGTASNLPEFKGTSSVTKKPVQPSKVLAVGLKDERKNYYVVVAHLSSKRNNSEEKDAKRAAQAEAIRKAVVTNWSSYDHVIVMGDMNDLPDSKPLKTLLGEFDDGDKLVQVATDENYSYIYRKKKQLIDHILVDIGLSNAEFKNMDLPKSISDHRISTLIVK